MMAHTQSKYEAQYDEHGQAIFGGTTKFKEELGYRQIIMWQLNRINLAGSEALVQPVGQHLMALALGVDILEACISPYIKSPIVPIALDFSDMTYDSQFKVFTQVKVKLMSLIHILKNLGLLIEEIGEATV